MIDQRMLDALLNFEPLPENVKSVWIAATEYWTLSEGTPCQR